ncbi:MAG: methionyl-tRNA formyltransferase [Sphingobacteriaceae bacterium]
MRIIFMGTPEFAVTSLSAILGAREEVVAVVTAPDKPAGRGQKLSESAVKQFAVANGIPVLQPHKLKDPDFLAQLKSLNADLQIVVAFRMLPEAVWNMPPLGTINLHGSLLPQYRGAAPINWAIMNGEAETGVTTFKLQHEIDTGDILLQDKMAIGNTETAGELHDRMKEIGAQLLVKTVKELQSGSLKTNPQPSIFNLQPLKHAPKIFKEDCEIDWHTPMQIIFNRIRGLSPYPTAFTHLNGKTLKVFKAEMLSEKPQITPGAYLTDHKTFLKFASADGFISVKEIQMEGKKKMGIEEFLRGVRL